MTTEKHVETVHADWKRHTFINHKNGTIAYTYFYQEKHRGITVKLQTRKALHLAGYNLINKDLRDAKIWLEEARCLHANTDKKTDFLGIPRNHSVVKALLKAALLNYQKAFSPGEGRLVALDKNALPKELRNSHETLEDLRHNYVAHGGKSSYESCEIVLALPPRRRLKTGENFTPFLDKNLKQAAWLETDTLTKLIDVAIEITKKKIIGLEKTVLQEILSIPINVFSEFIGKSSDIIFTQTDLENFAHYPLKELELSWDIARIKKKEIEKHLKAKTEGE